MIAWSIRIITGVRARWAGVEPLSADGAVRQRIYFANHTSNLDAPVIWASLPRRLRHATRPVAAQDYWLGGPVRRYLATRVFKCVLIERKRVTVSSNPLGKMGEALEQGSSLIIFPEGGRFDGEEGEVGEFKPGLWHLARRHPEVELVPVYLENLNRILPKGDFLIVPLLAAVTFGTPIRFQEDEPRQEFLSRAREAVAALENRGDG